MMTGEKRKTEKLMSGKKLIFLDSRYLSEMLHCKGFQTIFLKLPESGDRIVKL